MTWTISSLLDWTTLFFKKYGIEEPHLEAEILLAHSLSIRRIELYVQHNHILKEDELSAFKQLILRRAKKEPAAYIIGYKSFMSLDFIVSKDVLIPRPETEKLVETAIDASKYMSGQINIFDIGCGSGAIAISIAKYAQNSFIYAVDSSAPSLEIAKQNAVKHGVIERISFLPGNLFDPIHHEIKFDIIVSNPPYIPTSEINNLQSEIKDFEPISALDGGQDGLDFYRKIAGNADKHLKESGIMLLEIGFGQANLVKNIIDSNSAFGNIKIYKDHGDIDRVISAAKL